MSRKKRGKTAGMIRLTVILLCIAAMAYLGMIGYVWIRERSVPTKVKGDCDYDAVIVLGAQVRPDGELSVQLQLRLDTAVDAYMKMKDNGSEKLQIVVCGAQGKDEPEPEAYAMQKYLVSRGVPSGMIQTDPESFNTKQNLKNAKRILGDSARKVLVVTSDYHVPRALALAGDLGFEAEGVGSPCLQEYWIKNHSREALAWCKYWFEKIFHIG